MTIDTILQGDVRSCLKQLEDESVQCCVTSPPYWGLRDYGTATWEGGDPNCDHLVGRFTTPVSDKQATSVGSGTKQASDVCPKCGARRIDSQIGLEPTPEAYVADLVDVFREVKRVLRNDGTLWLNLGDSYAGSGKGGQSEEKRSENWQPTYTNKGNVPYGCKPKDLVGIPWRVAFALQADGWYLRSDIIWAKPNPMPESVTDRPTKSHEYVFLLSKSDRYYYDAEAIKEPASPQSNLSWARTGPVSELIVPGHTAVQHRADRQQRFGGSKYGDSDDPHYATKSGNEYVYTGTRNKRDVWTVATEPCSEAHFAVFPSKLIEPMILAGSPRGGVVLDPFMGSGTTALQCVRLQRHYLGCELNPAYVKMAERRIAAMRGPLFEKEVA